MPTSHELAFEQKLLDVQAAYDAAQTTSGNMRHWQNADNLAAHAALSPTKRRILRSRARYECQENNSYGFGIVNTLATDCVGRGPRLQLRLDPQFAPSSAKKLKRFAKALRKVEKSWQRWAKEVKLTWKLQTARRSKAVDGEYFAVIRNNPGLKHEVKLDVVLVEADQIATPDLYSPTATQTDGIRYDSFGNPTGYDMLRQHPGSDVYDDDWTFRDYTTIPAKWVIHGFTEFRPNQQRGLPEVTPALQLFADMRRFTQAVLAAAEVAACLSGVMRSTVNDFSPRRVKPMQQLPLDFRQVVTLPEGWTLEQFKAQQPVSTYAMFKRELLNEIGRCLSMPYNVTAMDSSEYNYASGRLDHQVYHRVIDIERCQFEENFLDKLFDLWFEEAFLRGLLPALPYDLIDREWHWPGFGHVDPMKEAGGQRVRLQNGTTTRTREYAAQGLDIEEQDEIAAREFGFEGPDAVRQYRQALAGSIFSPQAVMPADQPDDIEEPAVPSRTSERRSVSAPSSQAG